MTKKKILVAMSGGIDSSVAAFLLKKRGFEVYGIGLKLLNPNIFKKHIKDKDINYYTNKNLKDAKKIAKNLGIPFFIFDASKKFKKEVLDYFAKSYLKGNTPNPCIICNQKIKFNLLLKQADKLDIKLIATGHYANIIKQKGLYYIQQAKDKNKDQSYFLCGLDKNILNRIILPLGNLLKSEVKEIAKNNNLYINGKKESQDVCFKSNNTYSAFLENLLGEKPKKGPIIDNKGKKIGQHKGLINYTIGQRKGLGIANPIPLYVLKILSDKNTLIVGSKKEVASKYAKVKNMIFFQDNLLEKKCYIDVKIRSNHKPAKAKLNKNKKYIIVEFDKPQNAVTPGQAAVFYKDKKILASGWLT